VRFSGFKVKNQNLGNKIKSLDRLPLGYHFPDFQSVLALTVEGTLRAPSVQGDFRIHPIKLL
jgi:hypothetical protein